MGSPAERCRSETVDSGKRNLLKAGLLAGGAVSLGLLAYGRVGHAPGSILPQLMGELSVVNDESTGLPLLRLPPDFRYKSFSWGGSELHDGNTVPGAADGMGVVRQVGTVVTMVRNHELKDSFGPNGNPDLAYDVTNGGTTTLVWDIASEELIDSWISLDGTLNNCAGGVTPWGTWLSCEEAPHSPELNELPVPAKQAGWNLRGAQKDHGWVFEVPADGVAKPVPIRDMGQFYHEAVAFDPRSGIAYLTEDNGPVAGFYRFISNQPGQLAKGGRLQMMKVVDRPFMNDYLQIGVPMDVEWVDIADPHQGFTRDNRKGDGVAQQGLAQGASVFVGLEGVAYDSGYIYFTSKLGGKVFAGYVYQYDPVAEKIWLIYESPSHDEFSGPDNIVVSPRGSLLICEDRVTSMTDGQRLAGLTPAGELFGFCQINPELKGKHQGHNLAKTAMRSEWAGACWSDDGQWLFVNIYNPGITLAITGPWQNGLL